MTKPRGCDAILKGHLENIYERTEMSYGEMKENLRENFRRKLVNCSTAREENAFEGHPENFCVIRD